MGCNPVAVAASGDPRRQLVHVIVLQIVLVPPRVARGPTLSSQNLMHQDRDVSEAIWNPTFVSFAFFV